jgi:hypothetical protein
MGQDLTNHIQGLAPQQDVMGLMFHVAPEGNAQTALQNSHPN